MTAAPHEVDPNEVEPNRRQRRVLETRSAILSAARALFDADGYAETTVELIAERADVAPRTFFRYFPTKESLLFAALDEVRLEMLSLLEQRPLDEDPLVSLSTVLGQVAHTVEQRREDLAWGFRMCDEHGVEGVYERAMIKHNTHERIAEFIAARLGVDAAQDPRPLAWTSATMAVFASAMKMRSQESPTAGDPIKALDALLLSTSDALRRCAEVRRP